MKILLKSVILATEIINCSGKRIKKAREAAGMEQVELIAALEVDYSIQLARSAISKMENQTRRVKDYELRAIARILNVETDWLLENEW